MPDNTLYVVFNGLINLIHRKYVSGPLKKNYVAVMIKIKPHHYLAGSWLNEQPIRKGRMTLGGLNTGGSVSLNTKENAVVKIAPTHKLDFEGAGVQAYIELPMPEQIYSRYQLDITARLNGRTPFMGKSVVLSGVQVFQYSYADFKNVVLQDSKGKTLWTCPDSPRPGTTCNVLHFYSEPAFQGDGLLKLAEHNLEEFNSSSTFLGKPDPFKVATGGNPFNLEPPAGMLHAELASLGQREEIVNHLVGFALTARAAMLAGEVLPPEAFPIYDDPANCTGPDGYQPGVHPHG